jgi:quercetin dioxygenase-like cupin family protein/SAM-dependent methyltransferase
MKLINASEVPQDIVREPGAKQVTIRRLIDAPDGADRFLMSMFELGRSGATPPHQHEWEHEIYVLSGSLRLELPDERKALALRAGDVVFIPRGEPHGLATGPDETARLLLVAPAERPPTRSVFLSDEPYEFDERQTQEEADADGWPSDETTRLHRIMFGYLSSRALFSALELGVFDGLEERPATAEELGERLGLRPRPMRVLLTSLLGDQLVERDGAGVFRNTPVASRHLVTGKPEFFGALATHQAGHFTRFAQLTDALRADEPIGAGPGEHPAFGGPEKFAAVTRAASIMMTGGLVAGASLKGHRHMVDLGCGSGVNAIAFANANPELRITAVDRPSVCELARRNIDEAGLSDRVTVQPGDIFTDRFPDADVALLSNVVEGFSPDRAQALLRHVASWLPDDGELLLHAHMWEHGQTPFPFSIGLILLVNNTMGGEPYGAELTRQWLADAGFAEVSTAAVSPISAVARARKS